jgi:hypothetical protein
MVQKETPEEKKKKKVQNPPIARRQGIRNNPRVIKK